MSNWPKNNGFSLTEVLLAVGTLAIGLLFISGTFVAGIHFSTIATERTIAAIAADEAFAKVRIYGVNLASTQWQTSNPTIYCVDFNEVSSVPVNPSEFAYPSTRMDPAEKQYCWSALCRQVEPDPNRLVQVTVFISRKVGSGTTYQGGTGNRPIPMTVSVSLVGGNVLQITEPGKINWINDGDTIVENTTGQIYRVVKRRADVPDRIELDRAWQVGNSVVWVVPPPVNSGRKPCITVYQKVIRF